MGVSQVFAAKNNTKTPITLSSMPEIIMSVILMYPLPNTIALGAVATGNIKARLTQTVNGSK
jgi:hypothetical protein